MVKTSPENLGRGFVAAGEARVDAEVDGSGPAGERIASEDHGCTVAMVHVAIHGHGASDFFITLHAANGDGHVVNQCRSLRRGQGRHDEIPADINATDSAKHNQPRELNHPPPSKKAFTSSGEYGTSNSSSSRADSVPVFSLCTY